MNLEEIRDALLQAMDTQHEADVAANAQNQTLGQQKIMYNNDARGTLYSGQPTWERAQLAAKNATELATLNDKYMSKKLDVWTNITKTLDQINSYNKAAAALSKASGGGNNGTSQSVLDIYNGLGN